MALRGQDADGDTDTATVSIKVAAQNDPVDAVNDQYEVNEDGSVSLNLLANDKAPDGGPAIVSINGVWCRPAALEHYGD